MYKVARRFDDEIVFYFDTVGNKYVARGGSLSWRINNPGLVQSRGLFSRSYGAIGCFGPYAIFPHPEKGRRALKAWIQSKAYLNHSLKKLAKHYAPKDPHTFLLQLASLSGLSSETKVNSLQPQDLNRLLASIEKLCGYMSTGNEQFLLSPKITAKIENGKNLEDTYLVGDSIVLSKKEAIEWIQTHQLDAVIVHGRNGAIYLRSRPQHHIQHVNFPTVKALSREISTLARSIGENRPGQCIWGFINGISNTKEEALASAKQISQAAGGERVLSLPNDTVLHGIHDIFVCIALKSAIELPIIQLAAKFFKYLLSLADNDITRPPVIIFAHSQGAIITEHALALLEESYRKRLIIFTFGGGSFISPSASHPDSHNYASASDSICRLGSPTLQFLALQRYFGHKEGQTTDEVIHQLAVDDALLHIDSIDPGIVSTYTKQRTLHYEGEFAKISNVTVLDPDPKWQHRFFSSCYQDAIQTVIKKYQRC